MSSSPCDRVAERDDAREALRERVVHLARDALALGGGALLLRELRDLALLLAQLLDEQPALRGSASSRP